MLGYFSFHSAIATHFFIHHPSRASGMRDLSLVLP